MSIRILLADDQGIVRQGLRSLLEKEADMEVVGEAEDGHKALELVQELVPDVVIMDITMPSLNGVEATRQIVHKFPKVKVIALSIHSNRQFVISMLKAGASGYMLKECLFDELVEAVRDVSRGGSYLSPRKVASAVTNWVKRPQERLESLIDTLTDREHEVFQLVCEGKNRKQIALELHVTRKAIDGNINNIKKKLKADSMVDLIIIGLQEKVISLNR